MCLEHGRRNTQCFFAALACRNVTTECNNLLCVAHQSSRYFNVDFMTVLVTMLRFEDVKTLLDNPCDMRT